MTDKISDAIANFINSMAKEPSWAKDYGGDRIKRVGPIADLQARVGRLEAQMAKLSDREGIAAALKAASSRANEFAKQNDPTGWTVVVPELAILYFFEELWKEKNDG